MESSTTTKNIVVHERSSNAILAARESASQASSRNEASSQSPISAPSRPISQGALTHHDEVSGEPLTSLHSVPEMRQHPAFSRIDASTGLRDAQGYQNRRTSGIDVTTIPFPRNSSASDDVRPDRAASSPRASASKPSGRNVETCCKPLDPARHSSLPTIFPKAHCFRIGYGMLLSVYFTSQIPIQVLMVLCVNGHFGHPGFIVAGFILTLLMGLKLMSIVMKVVTELKGLKQQAEESV